MARTEATLPAVRAIGYSDVELLWSFGDFGRTPAQGRASLATGGAPGPLGPHLAGNAALRVAPEPRDGEAARAPVPDRAEPSHRRDPHARRLAAVGRPLQHRPRRGAEGRGS